MKIIIKETRNCLLVKARDLTSRNRTKYGGIYFSLSMDDYMASDMAYV